MAAIEIDISKEIESVVRRVQNEFLERIDKLEKELREEKGKRWLNNQEAAERLGVSVATFIALRKKFDDFPDPTHLSDVSLRWDKEELDLWMKKHKVVSSKKHNLKFI